MPKPTEMGKFFDSVHEDYDSVHTSHIDNGKEFYAVLSTPVKPTKEKVRLLNIGCGTGLEFESILPRIPNAEIDCVDLSPKMLGLLQDRLALSNCELNVFCCSYLRFDYQSNVYDYIIAAATHHHLVDAEKKRLFSRLFMSLKDNGVFIVGDKYVSSGDEANARLQEYLAYLDQGIDVKDGTYHIDIPTTVHNEVSLLSDAGFNNIDETWTSKNYAIIAAAKEA